MSRSASEDMIAVPRSLLGAAAYCARHHAGTESQTYKSLSDASMSDASEVVWNLLKEIIGNGDGAGRNPQLMIDNAVQIARLLGELDDEVKA